MNGANKQQHDRQRFERDRERRTEHGPASAPFRQVDTGRHHQAGHDERRLAISRAGQRRRKRSQRQEGECRIGLSPFGDLAESPNTDRETADHHKPPGDLTSRWRQPGERCEENRCSGQVEKAVSGVGIDVAARKPLNGRVAIR